MGNVLDRSGRGVLGPRNVVGLIAERFLAAIGVLLKTGAGLANCIFCAVVPGDEGIAVGVSPGAVNIVQRPLGVAIFFQSDDEGASATVANDPFADIAAPGGPV